MKIISGGQTGVDRAALDAALDSGLPCGGYCPLGRKAEDGIIPQKYPLHSLPSAKYRHRTIKNLLEADATLIFFNRHLQGGTRLTAEMCRKNSKLVLTIDADSYHYQKAAELARDFILDNKINCLNVAGPRKSQWPEGYDYVYQVLHTVMTAFHEKPSVDAGH